MCLHPLQCLGWGGAAATFPPKTQRLKVPNNPLLTLPKWGYSSQLCPSGASLAPTVSKLHVCAHIPKHLFSQLAVSLPPLPPLVVVIASWLQSGRMEALFHTTAPPPGLPFLCSEGRSVATGSNKSNRSLSFGQGSTDIVQVKPSRRKIYVSSCEDESCRWGQAGGHPLG